MKRKLDDIELEEIEYFHIDQTTLIIRTKTEEVSYSYPNSLELLRRIGYLLHRYEVEYNRKEYDKKEGNGISLTPVQKKYQKQLMINRNLVFELYVIYMLLVIMLPSISSIVLVLFYILNTLILINSIKISYMIKKEKAKQALEKQNYTLQIEKGYESLKKVSISYLNKIMKATTNFTKDESYYIDVIEKGFQKRIGTYPQQ